MESGQSLGDFALFMRHLTSVGFWMTKDNHRILVWLTRSPHRPETFEKVAKGITQGALPRRLKGFVRAFRRTFRALCW